MQCHVGFFFFGKSHFFTQCTSNFLALSIFLQFLKMAPAPNFGVFLDFARPFLIEVDFSIDKFVI